MASKEQYEKNLARYDEIVSRCKGFERQGKSMPFTSANGHMFSLLNKDGELGFRYSKEVQEKYIEKWDSGYLKSHGATMRGYVMVPEKMYKNLNKLAEYLTESYEYVMSLDPK